MKQDLHHVRRAAALLIAAAALPLSPAFAQDTQAPAPPPPAAEPAPPPAAQTAPVDVQAPPAPTVAPTPAPVERAPAMTVTRSAPVRAAPAPAAVRAPTRTTSVTVTTRPAATVGTTIATPAPVALAPVPAPVETLPASPPVAIAPAPPPPAVPTETQATDSRARIISLLPWIVGALLLAGIIAFVVARRRRREEVYYENDVVAPVAEPVVAAPVAAFASERPWIDLALEPVRAGVEGNEAVVEFALRVDNRGAAAAHDVRVSAFMLQAGASEAERSLIAPKEMPAVTIAAGETKQVETAVALPTAKVEGDAVLPVVVADARHTLPDGSEGHTSASFAVGVADGEELAHFAVNNPSGLHEGVVARALGEMEQA
jgi:hypothetical protein